MEIKGDNIKRNLEVREIIRSFANKTKELYE